VERCTLNVLKQKTKLIKLSTLSTSNVQRSTYNVQLGRGFANRIALSPAAARVPPLGGFETSIHRAVSPLNVAR
ncbi:MAG TPA: hypothetical protein PLW35_07390, partial [Verrucomicrobiota bacterium]|nr:hypothetical protein [Verrucomicrobiota bacterium]